MQMSMQRSRTLIHNWRERVMTVFSCISVITRIQPGSPVHGILQTRMVEWVAISYSRDQIFVCCIFCTSRQILLSLGHLK